MLTFYLILYVDFQCPTTIVPFFGDQPFWGERVHSRGVGPPPIPVDQFNLTKLVDAIKFMLDPKVTNSPIVYLLNARNNNFLFFSIIALYLENSAQLYL